MSLCGWMPFSKSGTYGHDAWPTKAYPISRDSWQGGPKAGMHDMDRSLPTRV